MTDPERRGKTGPRPGHAATRLTPETRDHIVRLVRAGNYLGVSAQHAGIGESTLHLWLKIGRDTAAARDAHPDDRLYCPNCDTDRTGEVREEEEANRREEERAAITGNTGYAYAVLGPCPHCEHPGRPAPWQPTDYQRRCVELLEAVTQADTEAEAAAVVAWRSAFNEDWRAARDYLVRRHPNRWAATTRIAISAEESEQRMDRATQEVLASLGLDTPPGELAGQAEWDEEWNGDVREVGD